MPDEDKTDMAVEMIGETRRGPRRSMTSSTIPAIWDPGIRAARVGAIDGFESRV